MILLKKWSKNQGYHESLLLEGMFDLVSDLINLFLHLKLEPEHLKIVMIDFQGVVIVLLELSQIQDLMIKLQTIVLIL